MAVTSQRGCLATLLQQDSAATHMHLQPFHFHINKIMWLAESTGFQNLIFAAKCYCKARNILWPSHETTGRSLAFNCTEGKVIQFCAMIFFKILSRLICLNTVRSRIMRDCECNSSFLSWLIRRVKSRHLAAKEPSGRSRQVGKRSDHRC